MTAKRNVQGYLNSGASQYAGMLAFSLFVALLPLLLGILTVWGFIARRPSHFLLVKEMVIQLFPAETQQALSGLILGAGEHAGALALVSVLGLLWFSTGLFSSAGFVLNRINGMPNRNLSRSEPAASGCPRLSSSRWWSRRASTWPSGARSLPALIGVVAIWIALTWLIGFLYRLAPTHKLPRADIIPGAALAGAAIVSLSYIFPVYAQLVAQLRSGEQFFAAVFGLAAWLYLVAQVLLIGALLNRIRRR